MRSDDKLGFASDFVIKDGVLVCYMGKDADIVIPEGINEIGRGAFIDNKKLQSVILPDSLARISDCAFSGCINLKSITIPAGVTFIDNLAFLGSGLEDVVIKGRPEIRLWAFEKTPWKRNEEKKNGGFIRGDVLLSVDAELTEYTIPPNVKIIGRDAFKGSKIKKITIPDGVTKLDICSFSFSSIEQVSLPNTLKTIGGYAFCGCERLTELVIPRSVMMIGGCAFDDLPNCVLTILNECDDESVFRISENAFGRKDHYIKEVRVPYGSASMRYAMKAGLNVTILPENTQRNVGRKKYRYIGNAFCCENGKLHEYFGHGSVVYVPEGISKIKSRAFSSAEIKKVYLPRSVIFIDEFAFSGCENLTEIKGEGVERIEQFAFLKCEKLEKVEFPNLQLCFDSSFEECDLLKRENIVIPEDAQIVEAEFSPCECEI